MMFSFPKYISIDERDKWVDIGGPILVFCMISVIYFFPFLFEGTSVKRLIGNSSNMKIFISITPSQIIFLAGPLLAAYLVDKNIRLKEKLLFTNWKRTYFPETLRLEMILILPLVALAALSYFTLKFFGYDFSSSPIIELLKDADSTGILMIFLFSVLAAPVVEEIAFRRVIFTFLARLFGSTQSAILTSLIFACMHGGIVQILPLFVLGLAFQYLYINNNSLYPSILLHCFHNTIVMLIFILSKI